MRILHQHLKLQHHSHTGRVLNHKHTSYRALMLIIGLASATIIGMNAMASAAADSYDVYARIAAPIPTAPSVILQPTNNTVTTKARITVSGTCEVMSYATIIEILDNDISSGSTICQNNGTFSMEIALELGRHVLIARTYTITNDTGPDSNPVTIFRRTADAGNIPDFQNPANGSPLVVTIDTPFITFGPVKNATWKGTFTGGKLPYRVHIDWDGAANDYTVTHSGEQQFVHHYRVMKPHIIHMTVTDAEGRSISRTYAAVTPYIAPVAGATTRIPWNGSMIFGLYGAYLLLLVVFAGLWVRTHQFAYAKVPARASRPATMRRRSRKTSHHS